jgi:TolB-like protein
VSGFSELRKRHLFQIIVVYLGVAWFFVEIVGFLVDNYELSRKVLDTAVMLAVLGFPAMLVIGWNHGAKGRQNVARAEVWLLLTLGVMAAIGTYRITTAEEPPRATPSESAAAPGGAVGEASLPSAASGETIDLGAASVAVFPFENNVSDPELEWLGSGLADMLTTNFAQLPELRGRQRLFDLLREAGRDETDEIPASLASTIAERSGAHSMVRGSVVGSEAELAIDAQLIDLETGTVVAAERVRGEDVFDLVDTLSARLARRLSGAPPAQRPPAPLARVATRDPEAARALYEGLRLERQGQHDEARVKLARSVELDSTNMLALMALSTDEDHVSVDDALRYRTMALREVQRMLPGLRNVFQERNMDEQGLEKLEEMLAEAQVQIEGVGQADVNRPPPIPPEEGREQIRPDRPQRDPPN